MARQVNKLGWERMRLQFLDDMRLDREAPIVLSPAAYEEVRRELGWQPPRQRDSQGAKYWEID